MKNYVVAHWRGELSLAKSFLLNGIVGYIVALAVVIGISQFFVSQAISVAGFGFFCLWQIWAIAGVLRCALRIFREPHSILQRMFAVAAVLATAVVIYYIAGDIQLLMRGSLR